MRLTGQDVREAMAAAADDRPGFHTVSWGRVAEILNACLEERMAALPGEVIHVDFRYPAPRRTPEREPAA